MIRWMHALLALPLLFVAACETQGVTTIEPSMNGEDQFYKINFIGSLNRELGIERVFMDEKDGFLRVQVELRNKSQVKKTVMYVFEWFNENGMIVAETDSTWVESTLFPNETKSYLGTAGSKAATDFRFKVRKK